MEICTYQELRSTVAESRIEREKEKKKKEKKTNPPQQGLATITKKKCSFPVNFGREKKKHTNLLEQQQRERHISKTRSICGLSGSPSRPGAAGAEELPAAALISPVPALPCLKLINITGYLGWRSAPASLSAPHIYLPAEQKTDAHKK